MIHPRLGAGTIPPKFEVSGNWLELPVSYCHCSVIFHQVIYMMAITYNYVILMFSSLEDCCAKF